MKRLVEVEHFFSLLNDLEISWILPRNSDYFASIIEGGDVDIILDEKTDINKLIKVLENEYIISKFFIHSSKEFFAIKFSHEGYFIKFHIRVGFNYGFPRIFKLKSHNLYHKRKKLCGDIFIPSVEDELIFLVVRIIFEKGGRKKKYYLRIKEILDSKKFDEAYILSQTKEIDDFFKIAYNFNVSFFKKIKLMLLMNIGVINLPIFIFESVYKELTRYKYGKLFVFQGIDGAGKTTITKNLLKLIPSRTKRFYVGGNLAESKFFLVRKLNSFIGSQSKKSYYKYIKIIRYPFGILDEIYRIFKIRYSLFRGYNVLSDRYIYESILVNSGERALVRKIKSFFIPFYPKPDILFLIDIEPEVAYSRKKDFNIEKLSKDRETFKKFIKGFNSYIIYNDNLEKSRKKILEKINNDVGKKITI